MHSARCLSELGRLDDAQAQAIEVQGLAASSRSDPTAMSLVEASSGCQRRLKIDPLAARWFLGGVATLP